VTAIRHGEGDSDPATARVTAIRYGEGEGVVSPAGSLGAGDGSPGAVCDGLALSPGAGLAESDRSGLGDGEDERLVGVADGEDVVGVADGEDVVGPADGEVAVEDPDEPEEPEEPGEPGPAAGLSVADAAARPAAARFPVRVGRAAPGPRGGVGSGTGVVTGTDGVASGDTAAAGAGVTVTGSGSQV
jgi:hypothetical protein